MFSLSALFGFRSTAHPEWTYEPPSLPRDAGPVASTRDMSGSTLRDAPVKQSESCRNVQAKHGPSGSDVAFTAFKSCLADAIHAPHAQRANVILDAFRACLPTNMACEYYTLVVREVMQLEWDPAKLLEELSNPKYHVPDIYSHHSLDMLKCLDTFASRFPSCGLAIHRIYVKLAHTASTRKAFNPYDDIRLLCLVRQLWQSAHLQHLTQDPSTLVSIRCIAPSFRNPFCRSTLRSMLIDTTRLDSRLLKKAIEEVASDVSLLSAATDVLSCVPKTYVDCLIPSITLAYAKSMVSQNEDTRAKAQSCMRVWLQLLHRLDARNRPSKASLVADATSSVVRYVFSNESHFSRRIPALLNTLFVNASHTDEYRHISASEIANLMATFDAKVSQVSRRRKRIDHILGMFMTHVKAKALPYQTLAQTILDILTRHGSLPKTAAMLDIMERRGLALAESTSLLETVARETSALTADNNDHIDAAALRTYKHIVKVLGRISTTTTQLEAKLDKLECERQFRHILDRAKLAYALPLAYRGVDFKSPLELRVRLIHQLAHQYSTDKGLSQREALRAVNYLYEFLQQHSLPIGPLISKAFVRLFVLRPLSENRFVADSILIRVCKLVASIEGEEVAKQIEPVFWQWRGNVIQSAKHEYVRSGGRRQLNAHMGTMKRLGLI
ncbi:hypothetical protein ACEQ8H_008189 [Pleosporales sp. CAS-2024a]